MTTAKTVGAFPADPADLEAARAVQWLKMSHGDSSLQVVEEANHGILRRLGHAQCNLISIFGAARQGKSFLMNTLAGQEDMFRISNAREPCTQGVDLCSHVMPLNNFAAIADTDTDDGTHVSASLEKNSTVVGFVDAEGQGDRDVTYDARLVTPVLLMSKVVIFNWKDSLQKDAILNLLGVMIMAAEGIKLGEQQEGSGGGGESGPKFEHLHIVFRDWNFIDVSEDEVFADLFDVETEPPGGVSTTHGDGTGLRNKARADLLRTFASIRVHLFPAPVASTADLATKIRFHMLTPRFRGKLAALRSAISVQLAEGGVRLGGAATNQIVAANQPQQQRQGGLTAGGMADILPMIVGALNDGSTVLPRPLLASMLLARLDGLVKSLRLRLDKGIDAIRTQITGGKGVGGDGEEQEQADPYPLIREETQAELDGVIAALLSKFDKLVYDGTGGGGMGGMGALFDPAVVIASRDSLEAYSKREVRQLLALNEQMQQLLQFMTEQVSTAETEAVREFENECAALTIKINADQPKPADLKLLHSSEGLHISALALGRSVNGGGSGVGAGEGEGEDAVSSRVRFSQQIRTRATAHPIRWERIRPMLRRRLNGSLRALEERCTSLKVGHRRELVDPSAARTAAAMAVAVQRVESANDKSMQRLAAAAEAAVVYGFEKTCAAQRLEIDPHRRASSGARSGASSGVTQNSQTTPKPVPRQVLAQNGARWREEWLRRLGAACSEDGEGSGGIGANTAVAAAASASADGSGDHVEPFLLAVSKGGGGVDLEREARARAAASMDSLFKTLEGANNGALAVVRERRRQEREKRAREREREETAQRADRAARRAQRDKERDRERQVRERDRERENGTVINERRNNRHLVAEQQREELTKKRSLQAERRDERRRQQQEQREREVQLARKQAQARHETAIREYESLTDAAAQAALGEQQVIFQMASQMGVVDAAGRDGTGTGDGGAAAVKEAEMKATEAAHVSAAETQLAARAVFSAEWETSVVQKLPMSEEEMDWRYGEVGVQPCSHLFASTHTSHFFATLLGCCRWFGPLCDGSMAVLTRRN
jgi:hypothetical protein